jgi:hypothetical protein
MAVDPLCSGCGGGPDRDQAGPVADGLVDYGIAIGDTSLVVPFHPF